MDKVNDMQNLINEIKIEMEQLISYSDILQKDLYNQLTSLIIYSCQEFIEGIKLLKNKEYYITLIDKGLKRFNRLSFDTEERVRICTYYEIMMDIVELESSKGLLNNWVYGFDII